VHDYRYGGAETKGTYEFFPNETELEIGKKIIDAVSQLDRNHRRERDELRYKLLKIEKRWWYKFFNYFINS